MKHQKDCYDNYQTFTRYSIFALKNQCADMSLNNLAKPFNTKDLRNKLFYKNKTIYSVNLYSALFAISLQ